MSRLRQLCPKALFLALVFLVVGIAHGQPAGGTSGGGGGQDGNPWNPNNWNVNFAVEYSGEDVVHNWVMDPFTGIPFEEVLHFSWSSPSLPTGAVNSSGTSKTVQMFSQGTIKRKIKWIGTGAPPSRVLVLVTSSAGYEYLTPGSGSADNGIGTPVTLSQDPGQESGGASGTRRRWIDIGVDGVGELELTKSATAESTGLQSRAYAMAREFSIAIDPKNVTITPWVSPTYALGYHDMPFPISNPDPTDILMMVGISYNNEEPVGYLNGFFTASLWGQWWDPVYVWAFRDSANGDSDAIISRTYTTQQIADIAKNGPLILNETVNVTDIEDGQSRMAKVELRVYAPQQFPVISSDDRKFSEWQRVSQIIHRSPSATVAIAEADAYATAITKQVTMGGGNIGLPKDAPLVLALNIPSFQYGVTATITHTQTVTYTIPPGPDDTLYWIEKRNFWQEALGWHLMYGSHGYEGIGEHTYTHWASETKELAEQNDREVILHTEPIEPNP